MRLEKQKQKQPQVCADLEVEKFNYSRKQVRMFLAALLVVDRILGKEND